MPCNKVCIYIFLFSCVCEFWCAKNLNAQLTCYVRCNKLCDFFKCVCLCVCCCFRCPLGFCCCQCYCLPLAVIVGCCYLWQLCFWRHVRMSICSYYCVYNSRAYNNNTIEILSLLFILI